MQPPNQLPNYVAIDFTTQDFPSVLRTPAKELTFPLSQEDQQDIQILEQKFDQEENCAGLAAPQIGISKRIIVFSAPDNPQLKQWRPDFTQAMDKTIWINPSFEPMGEEKHEDYEGCFSVKDIAGNVSRFKQIRYQAFTVQGEIVAGKAEGFLARLIQHEIDHINGKLFIDYIPEEKRMNIEEYRKKRLDALQNARE